MISIENLSKRFNKNDSDYIFKEISLHLLENNIFGLLGPNGSGKTTLLKTISGLLAPSEGKIQYDNKFKLSYVAPNNRSFYWRLTVRQNLNFFSALNELEESNLNKIINELSEVLDMANLFDKHFMELSEGQMQKVNLMRGMMTNPNIIILDEPLTFLDHSSEEKFIDYFKNFISKKSCKTAIWCSHAADHIDNICSKVGILSKSEFFVHDLNTDNNGHYTVQTKDQNIKILLKDYNIPYESFESKKNIFISFEAQYCDEKLIKQMLAFDLPIKISRSNGKFDFYYKKICEPYK